MQEIHSHGFGVTRTFQAYLAKKFIRPRLQIGNPSCNRETHGKVNAAFHFQEVSLQIKLQKIIGKASGQLKF